MLDNIISINVTANIIYICPYHYHSFIHASIMFVRCITYYFVWCWCVS